MNIKSPFLRTFLLGSVLAFGKANFAHAQGVVVPSGTITGSGSNPFLYDLTFSDAAGAGASIGSIWYSWVPGQFFLPGTPTSASAPSGWTATVVLNSIQFAATSAQNDIAAGQSLSGFSFSATFSPAQLAAAPSSGLSVAYAGGIQSDPGHNFTVQAVPEPSTPMLLLSGVLAFWLLRRRRMVAAV
jgi:hypothetical protein